jgi:hypothetical protein
VLGYGQFDLAYYCISQVVLFDEIVVPNFTSSCIDEQLAWSSGLLETAFGDPMRAVRQAEIDYRATGRISARLMTISPRKE